MSFLGRLPLLAAVGLVAAVAIVALFVADRAGLGVYSFATLTLPAAIAVLYLREYARKEIVQPTPSEAPAVPAQAPALAPATEDVPTPGLATTELHLFDDSVLDESLHSASTAPPKDSAVPPWS